MSHPDEQGVGVRGCNKGDYNWTAVPFIVEIAERGVNMTMVGSLGNLFAFNDSSECLLNIFPYHIQELYYYIAVHYTNIPENINGRRI